MIAILVLQIGGSIMVGLIRGLTRGRSTRLALAVMAAVVVLDQAVKAIVTALDRAAARPSQVIPGLELVNVRNPGVAFGLFAGGGALRVGAGRRRADRACWSSSSPTPARPLVWLPVGLLLGGAAGNLIDRVAPGVGHRLHRPGLWPAFNVADIAITIGVLSLLYVMEGPPRRHEREAQIARSRGAGVPTMDEPELDRPARGGRRAPRRLPGRPRRLARRRPAADRRGPGAGRRRARGPSATRWPRAPG